MPATATNDLDYLTARLHARRSRMAEGERLVDVGRCRTIPDLGRAVRPDYEVSTAMEFQRRLLNDLILEHSFCLGHLEGAARDVVQWMLMRFQVENVKVLLRGMLNHASLAVLQEHLVSLPREFAVDAQALLDAETPDEFARRLPVATLRKHVEKTLATLPSPVTAFLLEAILDGGYFNELFARINRFPGVEKELIEPLVRQQVEQFHFMLAVRGKFNFGYADETLLLLAVPGGGVAAERFKALLAARNFSAVMELGMDHVFDETPPALAVGEETESVTPALLELLAARRYLRLANNVFRRSHIGFAAVVAFLELRRIEVANLITISEGIRLGVAPESLRARLTQRVNLEVSHV